jgi:predicted metal-dependent peptidase
MLDFSRVVVLYVLQEQNVDAAVTAQTNLQRFFSQVQRSGPGVDGSQNRREATALAIGGENVVNLINFTVDIGSGSIGRGVVKRAISSAQDQIRHRRGGSALPRHRH